jgi:hypothetical protein
MKLKVFMNDLLNHRINTTLSVRTVFRGACYLVEMGQPRQMLDEFQ